MPDKPRLAIIGGGISGAISASRLQNNFDITLFEKARGAGGRMSTRRAEPYQFDHGAQYFTARSKDFQKFLKPHIQSGLVQDWQAKIMTLGKNQKPYKRDWFEPHYVCAPKMNSLCKHLLADIRTHFSIEIVALQRTDQQWILEDKTGDHFGPFDWVIMSVPSHQAINLLPQGFEYYDAVRDVKMSGCYSVMLGFENRPQLNWDIALPKNSLIGWIAVNSSKPGRETAPSILIQTTNDWAEQHLERDVQDVEDLISREFCELTGITHTNIAHKQAQRWRYANTPRPASEEFFLDRELNIGVCGDWCLEGRVESAFLSADKLCKEILSSPHSSSALFSHA